MFQREVAERIVAAPRTKAYGRLAVLAQWRSRPKILFEVPARAFTPPPKVTSAVVRFEPRADAEQLPVSAVEAVTAAAFGQRRKMLRSSLKSLWPDPGPALAAAGITPTLRAEELPVEAFLDLAEYLQRRAARCAFAAFLQRGLRRNHCRPTSRSRRRRSAARMARAIGKDLSRSSLTMM